MTSVTFPFFVGLPGPDKTFPLLDAEFRFTTKTARQLDKACGCGITFLSASGQSVHALVLLVTYGLKWQGKLDRHGKKVEITEDLIETLIDEFIDAGGDVIALTTAAYKALNESGVFGKPKPEEPDPLEEKTAPEPATVN